MLCYSKHTKCLSCPNSENILSLILNRNPNIFPCLTQESIGARLYCQPWDSSKISENHFYNMRLFPSLDREAGGASPGSAPRGCSFPRLVGMVCLQANQILWKKHLRTGNGHFLSAPLFFSLFFFFLYFFFPERYKPQGNTIPAHNAVTGLLFPLLVGCPTSCSACPARGQISLWKLYFLGHDTYI